MYCAKVYIKNEIQYHFMIFFYKHKKNDLNYNNDWVGYKTAIAPRIWLVISQI